MEMELHRWKDFVVNCYLKGLSPATARNARVLHGWALENVQYRASVQREGLSAQVLISARRREGIFMHELENFVRTKPTQTYSENIDERMSERDALEAFFRRVGKSSGILSTFYLLVRDDEQELQERSADPERRAELLQKLSENYRRVVDNQRDAFRLYERQKMQTKARTPTAAHRFVDLLVELFVYERYETLVLYMRRHLPGPVGAFHGLPERGGRR